jgi:peptide/nickel transport system substrate-binding protein
MSSMRIAALVAVFGLVLAGCAGGGSGGTGLSPAPAPAEGQYNPQPYENIRDGGTYTTAIGEITPQLNVLHGDAVADTSAVWRWYNALPITFTAVGDPVFNPDYLLSATEETVDGNTRITYTINPAATFNDGTPMDWRIFENQARILSGKDPAYIVSSSDGYDRITSVTRGVDDRQAVVTFAGINLWWPGLFNVWLHPAVNTPELFNTGYLNEPHAEWGAGPYTIGRLDRQVGTIVFERNPRWWGKRGKLDSRTYVVYEAQASLNAFRNGQLDATVASSAERLAQVRDLPGVEIRRGTTPATFLFTFNGTSPILADPAVRKALMQSIDRVQLGRVLHQGLDYEETPPGSLALFRFQEGYQDNFAKVITFDPEAAGRALDAAGWIPGPDGVRVRDGKPFVIEYVRIGDSPLANAVATATAAMLKNVGVTMNIRAVQSSEFSSIVAQRSFDLLFSGYVSSDPYGFAYFCQAWCTDSQLNVSGTGTPELDQKVRTVQILPTEAEVITRGNEVETEAFATYGVMPIDNGPAIFAVKQGLANVGAGLFYVALPETVGWQK